MEFQIKRFLKRAHLTQSELAKKLGCNQSLIAAWTSGRGTPTYEKIGQLILLGMSLEEVFGTEVAEKANDNAPAQNLKNLTPELCEQIVQLGMKNMMKDDRTA